MIPKRLPILAAVVSALLLAGCGGGGGRDRREPSRQSAPARAAQSALPGIESSEIRQCMARMSAAGFQFTPLPDRQFGGACEARGSIQLQNVGVPISNLGAMRCPLAETFAAWSRFAVLPAARAYLGTEVVKIESFGTYSCRNVNGASSGRLSQHAYANAVDVSGFVLADGRRITVLEGWNGRDESVRRFLRRIHESGCKRFKTTLGPEYNALHANHFHFDMGRGPFCK
ncbi:hypothetical protein FHS96_002090 [Sphingomonas zeicaulis]|uniref:extensin family protein n=1 Tax=Sphingomonas zeicaulis TaxID=1632740 RepID=UPI003D19F7BD